MISDSTLIVAIEPFTAGVCLLVRSTEVLAKASVLPIIPRCFSPKGKGQPATLPGLTAARRPPRLTKPRRERVRPACRHAVDLFCANDRPARQLERGVSRLDETSA